VGEGGLISGGSDAFEAHGLRAIGALEFAFFDHNTLLHGRRVRANSTDRRTFRTPREGFFCGTAGFLKSYFDSATIMEVARPMSPPIK
jgi:hypothetical protein